MQYKTDLGKFCFNVSKNILIGIRQELGLNRNTHFKPKTYNSKRVVRLSLANFPPSKLDDLIKIEKKLTMYSGLAKDTPLRITWGLNRTVIIEIPKPIKPINLCQPVNLSDLHFGPNPYEVPIGLDTEDNPVTLDFTDPMTTHVLMAGQTQAGKTTALKYLVWALARDKNPHTGIVIFDVAKSQEGNFEAFRNHPNLIMPILETNDQAAQALQQLESIRANGNPNYDRLFIVIDELRYLLTDIDGSGNTLDRLTGMAGQSGMHVLVATQYPQVGLLDGQSSLVGNLTTRLCGKVNSAANSSNALGLPDMGAEKLMGYGEFIRVNHESPVRLLFPHFGDSDVGVYQERNFDRLESVNNSGLPIALNDSTKSNGEITFSLDNLLPKQAGRPKRALDFESSLGIFNLSMTEFISTKGQLSQRKLIDMVKQEYDFRLENHEAKHLITVSKQHARNLYLMALESFKEK